MGEGGFVRVLISRAGCWTRIPAYTDPGGRPSRSLAGAIRAPVQGPGRGTTRTCRRRHGAGSEMKGK